MVELVDIEGMRPRKAYKEFGARLSVDSRSGLMDLARKNELRQRYRVLKLLDAVEKETKAKQIPD